MTLKTILAAWNDWLSAGDRLLISLHEQTAAVTLRDVTRLDRLTPQVGEGMKLVREADAQASEGLKALAEELGVEPGLRAIVAALPKVEGQLLQATANKIVVLDQRIGIVIARNRELLQKETTYVDGTLTLIAKAAKPKNSYGKKVGPYGGKAAVAEPILMDAAA